MGRDVPIMIMRGNEEGRNQEFALICLHCNLMRIKRHNGNGVDEISNAECKADI